MNLQKLKLILGFLSGLALLALFAFQVKLQLGLDDTQKLLILTTALGSFGVSVHGAYKMPPPGAEQ